MARRVVMIATWVCGVMLVFSLALAVSSIWINPQAHHLSLTQKCHVSVMWRGGLDSRISFFNNSDYGPYRGSIVGLVDEQGNVYPPMIREARFGDTAGIYYRYFQWSSGSVLWTLNVLIWYPAALFAILPAWSSFRRVRLFRTARSNWPAG